MPLTNSVSFLLPPNVKVFVQALSNAGFVQTVTLDPPGAAANAVFKGNGEGNVQMPLTNQGFLTAAAPGGQPSFTTPATGGIYKVTITTQQGSKATGGKLAVQNPEGGDFGLLWVISEDAADKDYNDAVVLFTYFSSTPPI
jgi:hypothetical protein